MFTALVTVLGSPSLGSSTSGMSTGVSWRGRCGRRRDTGLRATAVWAVATRLCRRGTFARQVVAVMSGRRLHHRRIPFVLKQSSSSAVSVALAVTAALMLAPHGRRARLWRKGGLP